MDPERLKRDFGDQIAFWGGGVDTQHIIPFAKPDEVAEHVKKLIKIFAPKGGFIYAWRISVVVLVDVGVEVW
jgi:uroporphyrinogen decarboxylase